MQGAGRVGDISICQSDSHGCPSCPHVVSGPATTGSSDVLINNAEALRFGDSGKHSSCCGSNEWVATEGAAGVLVNDRPIHRKQDHTRHCGGVGALSSGSPNVLIGDSATMNSATEQLGKTEVLITLYGAPLRARVLLTSAAGEQHEVDLVDGRCSIDHEEFVPGTLDGLICK
jgi:uncharacterized Zn-binding protein involved in type VI secretion